MKANAWILAVISCFLLFVTWELLTETAKNPVHEGQRDNNIQRDDFDKPRAHYGVVFDLGSSGSRANIFSWERNVFSHCAVLYDGGFHNLSPIATKKIKPGVSNLSHSPDQIGDSLAELWIFIEHTIPAEEHKSTPIFMFATAGLRVLAESENEKVYDDDDTDDNVILELDDDDYSTGPVAKTLNHLREYVETQTPFRLIRRDHIRVLTGREEGLFDFLTVQQLLRLNRFAKLGGDSDDWSDQIFNPALTNAVDLYPVCTVDLGGASTQLAFETSGDYYTHNITEFSRSPYKSKYPRIFTHSFLDYGINRAGEVYKQSLISRIKTGTTASDPCFFKGKSYFYSYNGVEYEFRGIGSYAQCKAAVRGLFVNQNNISPGDCTKTKCALKDVQVPPIPSEVKVVAFDHAYRVASTLSVHGYSSTDILLERTQELLDLTWEEANTHTNFGLVEPSALMKLPFEGMYVALLIHDGYGFSKTNVKIGFADSVDGQSLSWALGALVHNTYHLCEQSLL